MAARAPHLLTAALVVFAVFVAAAPAAADTTTPTILISRFGNLEYYFTNDVTPVGETYMEVSRVYNSYDNEQTGIFGVGWGSFFEENLELQDDGAIVVHEYGGGADNRFSPTTSSLVPADELRTQIMHAAGQLGQFGSEDDRQAYQEMLADSGAEEVTWKHMKNAGMLNVHEPAVGETFFSGRFGTEVITRVPEGYQRETRKNGGTYYEAFDLSGRLTRMWNKNHDFVALTYTSGQLARMVDNLGNRFTFSATPDGLVSSIKDSHGNLVRYGYDQNDDLVSVSINGSITRYGYDAKSRLISITFPNRTSMQFGYDRTGAVNYAKDASGTVKTIAYSNSATTTSRIYVMTTTTKQASGKVDRETDQYVYTLPEDYLAREIDNLNGKTTEYTYDADADILTKTDADGTTTFTYDALARRLTETDPDGTLVKWAYDPATGRPSTVTSTTKNSTYAQTYAYDQQGNLTRASDTKGLDFSFVHDLLGRFKMISDGSTQLTMQYANTSSFYPNTIVVAGMGSIALTYSSDGVVGKAQSGEGAAVVDKARTMLATINTLVKNAGTSIITLPAATTQSSKS